METFLRKYFFTVNLVAIFVASVLIARAFNRLLEPKLFGPSAGEKVGASSRGPSGPLLASAAGLRKEGRETLKANIFCSECPPIDADEWKFKGGAGDGGPASNEPVRSTLRLQLVSTVVSDRVVEPGSDDDWSFASIKDLSNQSIGLYCVASTLPVGENATVEKIEAARVIIKNAGKLEFLDLKDAPPPPPTTPHGGPGGNTGIAGVSPADLAKGIRKLGDNKYEIDRDLINKLLANTGALATTARIVPSQKDGKPNGFRVYGIRPGGIWSAIGVENGDTIHAINGLEMTTPDKALEVYTKIKNAAHLSISLSRRNNPVTMDYSIR